jgi:hypothetical protein
MADFLTTAITKAEAASGERWRPIKGFESHYAISDHGRVRNAAGRLMKLQMSDRGYYRVNLTIDRIVYGKKVHRLVAEAFVENPDPLNKTQVDHINNKEKLNNHWTNLRWASQGENIMNRGSLNGKKYKGVYASRGRYVAQIKKDKTKIHLGIFDTEEEAYFHYCAGAVLYHGEFAHG